MKCSYLLSTTLFCFFISPALAVNKCVDENGKVSYQNSPCPTNSRESEIAVPKKVDTSTPSASTPASSSEEEVARIQQQANQMERERKLQEIDREISRIEGRIIDYRSEMDNEIAKLKAKKQFANNDLAGATWEQSISTEMAAISQKYDALIRNEQDRISRLRSDADALRKTQ